jgi:hypothetical protein
MDDAMETVFSRMLTMRISHDLLSDHSPLDRGRIPLYPLLVVLPPHGDFLPRCAQGSPVSSLAHEREARRLIRQRGAGK